MTGDVDPSIRTHRQSLRVAVCAVTVDPSLPAPMMRWFPFATRNVTSRWSAASRSTLLRRGQAHSFLVVLIAVDDGASSLHRHGHTQGDDFALVPPPGAQPVRRRHRSGGGRQPVRGPELEQRLQPERLSVGVAAAVVAVRPPVGTRLRPAQADRGRAPLRVWLGAAPRHHPPASRSPDRARGDRGHRHCPGVPGAHRSARCPSSRTSSRSRSSIWWYDRMRARGPLVGRIDVRPGDPGRADDPGVQRAPRGRRPGGCHRRHPGRRAVGSSALGAWQPDPHADPLDPRRRGATSWCRT